MTLDFWAKLGYPFLQGGEEIVPRKSPYTIILSAKQRRILEARARKYTLSYRDVVRAQTILMAAQGLPNDEIAARLNTRREVVSKWRKRFFEAGVIGLEERPRRGRPQVFSPQRRRGD
jgi:DNA-binding CsgD family transcriptional regulator